MAARGDGVVLRALVTAGLVERPHRRAEVCREAPLDIRDVLQHVTRRSRNQLSPQVLPEVAAWFAMTPEALLRHVRELGRRTERLAQRTWRRVDRLPATGRRGSGLVEALG